MASADEAMKALPNNDQVEKIEAEIENAGPSNTSVINENALRHVKENPESTANEFDDEKGRVYVDLEHFVTAMRFMQSRQSAQGDYENLIQGNFTKEFIHTSTARLINTRG